MSRLTHRTDRDGARRGPATPRAARGFTLIELAVVVAIVGLLLGGLLLPLSMQADIRRYDDTRNTLADVREALLGYAVANGNRLPCPAASATVGTAAAAGACDDTEGYLPWATLGVGRQDAWGNPFRYRVDNAFSAIGGIGATPSTTSGLQVSKRDGTALTVANPDAAVAIVFSCGKNGVPDDANASSGGSGCSNSSSPDGSYVQDVYTRDQFDDVLVWLSRNVLLSRLVAAGTWP